MTIEEMKQEMEKAGYTFHRKLDEKLLNRRDKVYFRIFSYIGTKEYRYYVATGKDANIYCLEQYAQGKVRNKMKKKYGTTDYSKVPDEEWPAFKEELIQTAKDYIDKRFQKMISG